MPKAVEWALGKDGCSIVDKSRDGVKFEGAAPSRSVNGVLMGFLLSEVSEDKVKALIRSMEEASTGTMAELLEKTSGMVKGVPMALRGTGLEEPVNRSGICRESLVLGLVFCK